MKNELQELRLSSVVSTYAPGALVDSRAGSGAVSGIAAGLEEWDSSFWPPGLANNQVIFETRLQKKLSVRGFRSPPVRVDSKKSEEPDHRSLVAVRFPRWLQCPMCDLVKPANRWGDDPGKAYRFCAHCSGKSHSGSKVFVIPVRFVMACPNGHIDDFPWDEWVRHKTHCPVPKRRDRHPGLLLRSEKPGLSGLILSCPHCEARRSMDGIFGKTTWENGPKCRGHRPWLANGTEDCELTQRALQRGASNLYFPVIESALSIPPWTNPLQQALGQYWAPIANLADMSQLESYLGFLEAELAPVLNELNLTKTALAEQLRAQLSEYEKVDTSDLKPAEYRQFVTAYGRMHSADNDFEVRHESVADAIKPWIHKVVRAVRLREVRAVKGFTRINPPGDPDSPEVARLSKNPLNWLPAIEVRGEGIFLSLDEARVRGWEKQPAVINRVAESIGQHKADWHNRYGTDAPYLPKPASPRFVLCHTLAHVLMRQLTLECGYSSASLRERIYASTGEASMAGLLIYTSTPDSDGTLGGLERQGKQGRIENTLIRSLLAVEWCSSDPLCVTDMMGASNSYSHSVCHACCFAPETSCENFNTFLDRAFLVGNGETPGLGFFEELIQAP